MLRTLVEITTTSYCTRPQYDVDILYVYVCLWIISMLNLYISIWIPFPKREHQLEIFVTEHLFVWQNMVYKYAKSLKHVVCRAILNIMHTKRCEQTKLEPVYVKQNTFSVQMVRAGFLSFFFSFFCLTKTYTLQNK